MAVSFKEPVGKYNLPSHHYHSVFEAENAKADSVQLYNPYGKLFSIPKEDFFDAEKVFEICYFDNKIFGFTEIKTSIEFVGNWPPLKVNQKVHFVDYDLLVKEKDTEVLINLIPKHSYSTKLQAFIVTNDDKMAVEKCSTLFSGKGEVFARNSLRANLKSGNYKLVVVVSRSLGLKSCGKCVEYLENGGNEFLFRLAASKQCFVEKSEGKEAEKIERVILDWWYYDFVFKNFFSKKNILFLLKKNFSSSKLWI